MITQRKARRILHEGKAHGRRLTEKQRRFFGARASGYPMRYGDGGPVTDAYENGTHADLWKAWDGAQRNHFLIDHYDMLSGELESDVTKYAQKFAEAPWKDLPEVIRKQVALHHAMGFYGQGGTAKPIPMKYLTPGKKQLLSKINSIKERMKNVKDENTLSSIALHISRLEEELNKKIPTRDKINAWKNKKKQRRISRK